MSTILTADAVGADWPDHKQLPESDGDAMPNMQQSPQTEILNQSLSPVLASIHPDGQFCMASDCFIYFKYTQPVLDGCKAPDWFYVPGVPPLLDGEIRRSYVLWKEHVSPCVVVEYVSGDGSEERDSTPNTGKFWVYENAILAEFYVIFDPERATLDVHQRINARYQQLTPNAQGRFLIPPLRVELGIWVGNFRNLSGTWLRAWDPATDTLLPLDADRIETERQRADEQRERADEQKNRADEQRQRADEQQKRADEQRERADAAEQRAARLARLSRKARRGQASAEELLELEQLEQQIAPNGTA